MSPAPEMGLPVEHHYIHSDIVETVVLYDGDSIAYSVSSLVLRSSPQICCIFQHHSETKSLRSTQGLCDDIIHNHCTVIYGTSYPYVAENSVLLVPILQLHRDQDFLHPFHSACVLAKHAGMLRNLVLM